MSAQELQRVRSVLFVRHSNATRPVFKSRYCVKLQFVFDKHKRYLLPRLSVPLLRVSSCASVRIISLLISQHIGLVVSEVAVSAGVELVSLVLIRIHSPHTDRRRGQ